MYTTNKLNFAQVIEFNYGKKIHKTINRFYNIPEHLFRIRCLKHGMFLFFNSYFFGTCLFKIQMLK